MVISVKEGKAQLLPFLNFISFFSFPHLSSSAFMVVQHRNDVNLVISLLCKNIPTFQN